MSERVRYSIDDGVADVRLNRPEKLNALDQAMFDALIEAGEALRGRADLRAVVLSGEGRAFCAGLDLGVLAYGGGERGTGTPPAVAAALARWGRGPASVVQQAVLTWYHLPVPVVAAVHGHALGGGLQLALAADIRIVAADARLAVLEIRWGLIPDMGGTQLLPRLVGPDVARELTFTGRTVTGAEAVRLGLATRTSEQPLQDALDLAREIAGQSPSAIRAAKSLLGLAGEARLDVGLQAEQRAQRRLVGSPDQLEAVRSFLEPRPARSGLQVPGGEV